MADPTAPKTPEEALAAVRRAARKGKVFVAQRDHVAGLEPYVQKVLDVVAEVLGEPGMAEAFVTDESCISDFLDWGVPRDVREAQARTVSVRLGVDVGPTGHALVYEVALALAKRDGKLA